jgi:hypothetical protein
MTNIENYLASIENLSFNIESSSLANIKSIYIARAESIPGPIIVNILVTWAENIYILRAIILVLRFY